MAYDPKFRVDSAIMGHLLSQVANVYAEGEFAKYLRRLEKPSFENPFQPEIQDGNMPVITRYKYGTISTFGISANKTETLADTLKTERK